MSRKMQSSQSKNSNRRFHRLLILANLLLLTILAFLNRSLFLGERATEESHQTSGISNKVEQPSLVALSNHGAQTSKQIHQSHAALTQGGHVPKKAKRHPFYVAKKKWKEDKNGFVFLKENIDGSEAKLRTNARRNFISENQGDYPEPESGCGPTALLNLYIWYTKFGLLDESIRHADTHTYKQLQFQQIDQKLLQIQRESRTQKGGTNIIAAIVAMDQLLQQYGARPTRLHFEIKSPPLVLSDFTRLNENYRAGLLSVRPKNPKTGKLMANHMVLCIRGDDSGMITLANWGDFSHGRLIEREDGQWFVPRDASKHQMRINRLASVIPFYPSETM